MESSDGPAKITLRRLQVLSSRYDQIISSSLQDLDKTRAKRIPEALAQRRRDGCAYLDKIEVTALLDWKLSAPSFLNCLISSLPLAPQTPQNPLTFQVENMANTAPLSPNFSPPIHHKMCAQQPKTHSQPTQPTPLPMTQFNPSKPSRS